MGLPAECWPDESSYPHYNSQKPRCISLKQRPCHFEQREENVQIGRTSSD